MIAIGTKNLIAGNRRIMPSITQILHRKILIISSNL